MPKLLHICLARDEDYCIENMLKSVLPHVEASYVLMDDRSKDRTEEILLDYGCNVKKFSFENFGKMGNILLKWVNDKGDWAFRLAPDEMIMNDLGEQLRPGMEILDATGVDVGYHPRKNWLDLEMIKHRPDYPDWQPKLYRLDFPRIHYVNYVHETIKGFGKAQHALGVEISVDVHHFCWYWKEKLGTSEDKLKLYEQLVRQQQQDRDKGINNIWPD